MGRMHITECGINLTPRHAVKLEVKTHSVVKETVKHTYCCRKGQCAT